LIIWITGLSGSGKTTLGTALYQQLKRNNPATVLLDGDQVRAIFAHDKHPDAYSLPGRRASAERMHALCALLDQQGIDVVCCFISMFPDIIEKNKAFFSYFFEIHMNVPLNILSQRDVKGLYQAALHGKTCDVVGVDLPYPKPLYPDMIINNSFTESEVELHVTNIISKLKGIES